MNKVNQNLPKETAVIVAQITDSHLFSSKAALHYGCDVYNNLKRVLVNIANNPSIHCIVFTGDLTQDHSDKSYQNFVDCVCESQVTIPVYFLAGNHDEPKLMTQYFTTPHFNESKTIAFLNWQIQLVDSKSDTPAGFVNEHALAKLNKNINKDKHQLVMMHHHPIDVGYFIDKHGLQNKQTFWQTINCHDNIKGIACGHVHGAMELTATDNEKVTLYTCPATSIQFDPNIEGVGALAQGPGYRTFTLYDNGQLNTNVIML